jgi:UDP-N-acetylmuramoylalanine--D-glutamate ligase
VNNIYQDHLDRYKNMEDYINDKKNIYKYQTAEDYLILNNKNSETKKMAKQSKSKILWFDSKDIPADWDLRLLGKHNKENVAAALKVADIFDLDLKKVRQVCEDFKSVKNRLEPIDEIDGVLFVNDTTSTTPIATQAAIDAFDEFPIILIAGGNDKNLEIQDLAKDAANRTKGVFLLAGTGTPKFKEKIKYFGGTMIADVYENMGKCVKDAFEASEVGDVILLSPGFSSFGLFKNEFDRGEQFKKAVKKLKTKEKGRGDKEIATQFGKVLWGRHGSTEIDKADIR